MKHAVMIVLMMSFLAGGAGRGMAENRTAAEMSGNYWRTLSERSGENALLVYTSGYVGGYSDALALVLEAIQKQPYDPKELAAFIDMLKFPETYTNREIRQEIDQFYQEEKNRPLPLLVAFTVARQKIQGYPKSYSESYISKMRKQYAAP